MKPLYTRVLRVTLLSFLSFFFITNTTAQCPNGQIPGQTAYDTTISFATGATAIPVKFPQFDPQGGMVTCVRLCVTITGVIDTLALQNFAATPQSGTFDYIRTDGITGPGITTPLTHSVSQSYGPFPLTAYDGVPGAGTDFYSQGNDTILHEVLCRTISDSTTISQFYGTDSVAYNYNINVTTSASITGGSASSLVLTSALVNFRFEYCTCPGTALPLNVRQFSVAKLAEDKVELNWTGFDDAYSNYHYESQVSRDGHNFTPIATVPKNVGTSTPYKQIFRAVDGENGRYFFRIRQVYTNGYSRYSNIKQVDLENSDFPGFTLFPNPSNGIVGIKFDNDNTGHYSIQIYNTQGQTLVRKDIATTGSSYVQVATLDRGVYWLKMIDKKSHLYRVSQLLIK